MPRWRRFGRTTIGVECVQPGWDLLLGWEEVRERWARIFKNTKRVRVALSGIWVRVEGQGRLGGLHGARHDGVRGGIR